MRALSRNCAGMMTLALFVIGSACTAGDLPSAKIKVGEKMADFTLSEAGGGKTHSLYELKGKEYSGRGVTIIGINANKSEPSAQVAEHAQTHALGFPVLKDEGNVIADRLGASVTPEVFLLDSTWTVRYHGALGNSAHPTTKAEEASDVEVRPALEAVLTGQTVAKTETKAFGCTIKRL